MPVGNRVRVVGLAATVLLLGGGGAWGMLSSNAALATNIAQVALVKATFEHAMSVRATVTVPNHFAG